MLTNALHLIRSRRVFAAGLAIAMLIAALLASPGSIQPADAAGLGETTLDKTIVPKGTKGAKKKQLKYGPGQKRVTRSLIANYPKGVGDPIAAFRQISDVHTDRRRVSRRGSSGPTSAAPRTPAPTGPRRRCRPRSASR